MKAVRALAWGQVGDLRHFLYGVLIQSKLWLSAAVAAMAGFAAHAAGMAAPPGMLLLVFFCTLFLYNLDVYLDARGAAGHAERHGREDAGGVQRLTFTALFGSAVCALWAPLEAALLVAIGTAFCAFYAVPLGPHRFRLKALPGKKSLFVGTAVGVATTGVPWTYHLAATGEALLSGEVFSAFCLLWVTATSNATLFDIYDMPRDRQARLKTLPLLLGASRVRRLVSASCALGGFASLLAAPALAAPILVVSLFMLVVTVTVPRVKQRATLEVLVDGGLYLPWLSLWLVA